MFTHYPQDGLLNHIQRGRLNEEILVRTSRDMADYTFQRIPTKCMITDANLKMWNFPQIQPIKKEVQSLRFCTSRGKLSFLEICTTQLGIP